MRGKRCLDGVANSSIVLLQSQHSNTPFNQSFKKNVINMFYFSQQRLQRGIQNVI